MKESKGIFTALGMIFLVFAVFTTVIELTTSGFRVGVLTPYSMAFMCLVLAQIGEHLDSTDERSKTIKRTSASYSFYATVVVMLVLSLLVNTDVLKVSASALLQILLPATIFILYVSLLVVTKKM